MVLAVDSVHALPCRSLHLPSPSAVAKQRAEPLNGGEACDGKEVRTAHPPHNCSYIYCCNTQNSARSSRYVAIYTQRSSPCQKTKLHRICLELMKAMEEPIRKHKTVTSMKNTSA